MDDRFREIQGRYRAEMHGIMPAIMEWWFDGLDASKPDAEGVSAFESRWPAGPAAHPRVLEVFRRYFLETDAMNLDNEESGRTSRGDPLAEESWGIDGDSGTRPFVRPIDLLVHDLESVDPDLFEVLGALVFVPVGLDPNGEFV